MSAPGSCCHDSDLWQSVCQALPHETRPMGPTPCPAEHPRLCCWSSMETRLPLLSLHPFPQPPAVSLSLHLPLEAGPSLGTVSAVPPGAVPVSFCSGCSFLPITATPQVAVAVEMEFVMKAPHCELPWLLGSWHGTISLVMEQFQRHSRSSWQDVVGRGVL